MDNSSASIRLEIASVDDIVHIRRVVRNQAKELGFGLADQTRLATAVSELARNALQYAGGGVSEVTNKSSHELRILEVCISDKGPGIENIELAMRDGYSSKNGLGAGLPGCKRLMDQFSIESTIGVGTQVRVEIYATVN